jgi:hypothetical protein
MTCSLRCYTGTNAATESAAQTSIALLSVDAATNDPGSHKIAPGSNSMEKWVAVAVDAADGSAYSNFYVQQASGAPQDGVTIKVGFALTGATPTSATSTVAKTTLTAGRRYLWDDSTYDTTGQKTRFLVIQAQVAATAASGAIPQESLLFGWDKG